MAVNNPEWRDAWPQEPEAEALFKYFAHFYRQSIVDELMQPMEGEGDVGPTPELDRRIEDVIAKARRNAAWNKQWVAARKTAAVAAIVILLITAFPTVLFAVSPEFRETVNKYTVDWRSGHTEVIVDNKFSEEHSFIKYYVPTYIPDGFILANLTDNDDFFELHYANGEQYFYFTTSTVLSGRTIDNEKAKYSFEYRIDGLPAIVVENQGLVYIMWHDDITAFILETNLSLDIALSIAASYVLQEKI
jgi:hypothetical protein